MLKPLFRLDKQLPFDSLDMGIDCASILKRKKFGHPPSYLKTPTMALLVLSCQQGFPKKRIERMRPSFSDAERREIADWAKSKGRGHFRHTCPACSSQRKGINQKARCLSVSIEADKVLYSCHHCERAGASFLTDKPSYQRPAPPKPSGAVKKLESSMDDAVAAFLTSRGISRTTGALFGLSAAKGWFPDLQKEAPAVAYPYHVGGKVDGHKLRSLEGKAHICSKAIKSLFGIQLIDLAESKDIIIAEGEIDAVSFYEASVVNALSVPNGASSFGTGDSAESFLWSAKDEIEKAERIIIATDNDEPGKKLGEEIARRVGRHKCWYIEYPEGCKDANDVLRIHGADMLRNVYDHAKPWPIAGLYEADRFFPEVESLFKNGFADKVKTGIAAVDEIYSVGEGLLTVVTGIPANGKSTFVDQVMINLTRLYGFKFAICSFENPPHVHIAKLSEMLLHKHFFDRGVPEMRINDGEMKAALSHIHHHFKFFYQDDGSKATIDGIIERIKTAVFRWGIKGAVIDPFNYIERTKGIDSETQFIDDILTRLRLLASSLGIHIWFVAHPTKLPMNADGTYAPPRGFSISGSAAWYSKADFGLTVHKEDTGEVRIINWKTRFNWLGVEGEAKILYDVLKSTYISDPTSDLDPLTEEDYV